MSLFDTIVVAIAILVFSIAAIFGFFILSEFNTGVDGIFNPEAKAIAQAGVNSASTLDSVFLIFSVGLMLGTVALAFMIDTHPIFFVIGIIVFIIFIMIVPILSNAFLDIAGADVMAATMVNFPLMTLWWQNFPLIFLFYGALLSVVIYGRMRG